MAVIEAISTTYLEADAATITIDSIPSTYEHLQVAASLSSDEISDDGHIAGFYVNGDLVFGSYTKHMWQSSGSGAGYMSVSGSTGQNQVGYATSEYFRSVSSTFLIDILDYANTNKNTTWTSLSGAWRDDRYYQWTSSSFWHTAASGSITDAIDEITFDFVSGSFTRGSTVTLYGINSS